MKDLSQAPVNVDRSATLLPQQFCIHFHTRDPRHLSGVESPIWYLVGISDGMDACLRKKGAAMNCPACGSEQQRTFNGEIAIHFPGLEGLNKPIVWVFPRLLVCLDCGSAQFNIPERELGVLREERSADSARAA